MALTARENAERILHGEWPEYFGDFMLTIEMIMDPIFSNDIVAKDGEPHPDSWGTMRVWPETAPGPHPYINDETKVIKDICEWEKYLKVPDISNLDWSDATAKAKATDRREKFVCSTLSTGLFERSHFLMGFEDALCAYIEEPEAMKAMLRKIADWKLDCIDLLVKHVNPDVCFYHDDWASKQNLFLPLDVWRDIIKPYQMEISERFHDHGIMYMHHADCRCEKLAQDMVDLRVDLWQGALPQNDIVKIQKETNPQLVMIGGLDGAKIDRHGVAEEEVRAEVRRSFDDYCGNGYFFPSCPGGLVYNRMDVFEIGMDEHFKYGKIYAQEHRPSGA